MNKKSEGANRSLFFMRQHVFATLRLLEDTYEDCQDRMIRVEKGEYAKYKKNIEIMVKEKRISKEEAAMNIDAWDRDIRSYIFRTC